MALPRELALDPEQIEEIMTTEWNLRIATQGPGDRINLTPMWFGWAGGRIYIYGRGQKVANLRRRPECTVIVDRNEKFPELQALMFQGVASVLEDAAAEVTANVVRADALVAIFMPNQPQVPEKRQANRTPTGVTRLRMPANPRPVRITSRTANTIATTLYWRLRYAIAPARTAEAISIMSSSPSGYAITFLLSTKADISAATAATGATNQTHASVAICDRSASTNTFTLLTSIHVCAARTARLGGFSCHRYRGVDLRVQANASGEVGEAGEPADLP